MQTDAEDEKVVTGRIGEIIGLMQDINKRLQSIEVYQRQDPALLESTYNPIGKVIESFFKYINEDAVSGLTEQGKKALYEGIFQAIGDSELLFLADDLCKGDRVDADMLLVCASRASRERKSFLFLCNTALIRNILNTGAQIPSVVNLGILHHYTVSRIGDESQIQGEEPVIMLTGVSHNAANKTVEQVLETIPRLINDNIKNISLKVVLRCCSGGQQAHLPSQGSPRPLTTVYPLGLLPAKSLNLKEAIDLHRNLSDSFESDEVLRNAIFQEALTKGDKILVRQDEGSSETKIFLPKEKSPICVKDFPILRVARQQLQQQDKAIFENFSKQLIIFLGGQFEHSTPIYIDPFQVSLVAGQCYEHQNQWNQGVKLVGKSLLKEWEKPSSSSPGEALQGLSKKYFQGFFAPANSLKDKMRIHKDTYAGKLLAAIRGGGYVNVFKTYYGCYNAYKDRMVHESNSHDISDPKSITVTRANNFMEPVSEDGAKAKSSSKGVGGVAKN